MARIIFDNGAELEVQPMNGKDFPLDVLQGIVGGYIEIVHVGDELMVVNEEGMLIGLHVNEKASAMYGRVIVGNVLICNNNQIL